MALDDSAVLEMIEMLRTADGGELMRRLLGGMLQAVVDAEATAHIGAGLQERSNAARPSATASATSSSRPPPGT
jgi:putative transposase